MLTPSLITTNVAIEIFSSALCLVFLICILIAHGIKEQLNRIFIGVLLSNMAVMLSDALAFSSIGKPGTRFLVFNYIGNICTYLFSYLLIMFFSNYIVTYLSTKIEIKRTAVYVVYGICVFAILLTFVALWNGMYFYIDENNIYHRRDMYWLSQILGIFGLLINMGIIVHNRKHFNRVESFVLATYIILPVIAVTIQMLVYGFVSVYIASTITILLIYVGLQGELAKRLKQKEVELVSSRIDIMLSQIQPHFLYNTLTTIENLCNKDGAQAAALVRGFSKYLRDNMDSLKQKELVAFDRELEHIKIYLEIEKLRFEERLNIMYDFETTDFSLPILTVQPLVENAVRYGVTKKREGGTVTLSTRREPEYVKIIVADDGVGFDAAGQEQGGRSHVGIENVRSRLDAQCGGTLTIESVKGAGTTATIIIPGKEQAHE